MKYAKIYKGAIEFAPKNKGSILNYDKNVELMLQDGYKPFESAEIPTTNRLYHYEYEETSENIREVIVYDETQEQADAREEQQEQERKGRLRLTKRDFFLYVIQPYGITYAQLMQAISSNDTLLACYEGCNHIYRGDSMFTGNIKTMLEQITGQVIDEKELMNMLDDIFEQHNADI